MARPYVPPHVRPSTRPSTTGCPAYSETLPRAGQSARSARRLVRDALSVWRLEPLVPDSELVVSELVANAVTHARGHVIRVKVTRLGASRVRIGVVDKSPARPTTRQSGTDDPRGRGLVLVDAVAANWGTDPLPWGKRVWAELIASSPGGGAA
ncbi:ATP-binding protein [Streptomyces sp. JHD 1]|nr:ATP-binding protein [Streptomyces sp. JHD 1]